MHTHLTQSDRSTLGAMLRAGYSQSEIAETIGVHRSTVSNELRRNSNQDGFYHAGSAQRRARERRKQAKQGSRKIENDPVLERQLEHSLHPLRSPEVVSRDFNVSYETIYAWIGRSRPDLSEKLPQRGKKRRRYGSKRGQKIGWTQSVRSIDQRPQEAEERSTIGHWEGDTIRGSKQALLTLTERKSRYEQAYKLPGQKCDPVHEVLKEESMTLPVKSLTFDRGPEFALWKMIEQDTQATVYFADPRSPWQRGTNENANQRLRRVFPKDFDFSTITQTDLNEVLWIMNHTKRKCLNWRTPCEVYEHCCVSG